MLTTIPRMYDPRYTVSDGTVTDVPFLRSRDDWWIFQVLRHLAVRAPPPKVEGKPHLPLKLPWDSSEVGGGGQRQLCAGVDGGKDYPDVVWSPDALGAA